MATGQKINTADCLFNGIRFDLKTIGLDYTGIRGDNALFNTIKDKRVRKQASCFIIDVSRSGLTRKETITQAECLFFRDNTRYIECAILYDGEFFKIIERIK